MEYPNEITWVMVEGLRYLESGTVYGTCAHVHVNGEERFVVGPRDKWDATAHVTMFTRYTDTGIQVAGFNINVLSLHANLTELSQAITPLRDEAAFVPPF